MPSAEPLERARAAQGRGRTPLVVLFLTVFIDLLGFGIVIPFLPMYAARLQIGAFGIGLVLAIYSLMQFLCAPLLGRLSDHIGRRPVIMLGLLGSSLSYVIYGFAGSFGLLMLSRAVHGACAGTVSTAQAYVADTTSESGRAHGMGMIGAAFGLGFVLGPALGGLLGHSHLRVPVFFAAGLTFANLIFAAIALPESHPADPGVELTWSCVIDPVLSLPRQLTSHRLSRWFTIAFLGTFAMAAFETTFALMVPRVYGYGAGGIGGLFAFAGLVQVFTQGYLLRKVVGRAGEPRLIRIGMVAFALGMAPMASVASHALLLILLALLSAGYGLANPSVASLISKYTARDLQGEVLGVNQSALSLARIVGPILAGIGYEMLSPAAAYVGGGVAALIAFALTGGAEAAPDARKERSPR
ncbi:MAG TPA: MFS transporter [Candidatus Binataceae bacterium]|nr:MFS transporter [Candidatus Binataceae bacterium]